MPDVQAKVISCNAGGFVSSAVISCYGIESHTGGKYPETAKTDHSWSST
jgi:hypothetical protein